MILGPLFAVLSTLTVMSKQAPVFSIPRGAQHVAMMEIRFQADCSGDIPIEEVHLVRKGLGLSADIAAVYAEAGELRVSTAVSVARDGITQLRLKDFTVLACQSSNLVVFADFLSESSVAGEHRFELALSDAVTAPGAQVQIAETPVLPTSGVRTAGDRTGTVSIEYLRFLKPLRYGDNRVVMRLKLSARGTTDQEIRRITFTNAGSARDANVQDIVLKDSRGQKLSPVAKQLSGNRVILTIDPPLMLPNGGSRTVELHANIRSSVRKTIRFLIEEQSDIFSSKVHRRRSSRQ